MPASALQLDGCLLSEPPEEAGQSLSEMERHHIEQVLRARGGHVETAAVALGLPRSSLYAKLKKYGIAGS